MNNTQGTPHTLRKAIQNGLLDPSGSNPYTIQKHVRDFLAQKFSIAVNTSSDPAAIEKLWKEITGEDMP